MSTAYHPQTGGQTEVVNRCIQQYLRTFSSDYPSRCSKFLELSRMSLQYCHSQLDRSPFLVVYGKRPPTISQYLRGTLLLTQCLQLGKKFFKITTQFTKSTTTNEKYAVAHQKDIQFKKGGWVYVKLQPYQ